MRVNTGYINSARGTSSKRVPTVTHTRRHRSVRAYNGTSYYSRPDIVLWSGKWLNMQTHKYKHVLARTQVRSRAGRWSRTLLAGWIVWLLSCFLTAAFPDTVFATLFRTAFEIAISGVHKFLRPGGVPTSWTLLFWRLTGRSAGASYSYVPDPHPHPFPGPNRPHGFCGRKDQTMKEEAFTCEPENELFEGMIRTT